MDQRDKQLYEKYWSWYISRHIRFFLSVTKRDRGLFSEQPSFVNQTLLYSPMLNIYSRNSRRRAIGRKQTNCEADKNIFTHVHMTQPIRQKQAPSTSLLIALTRDHK